MKKGISHGKLVIITGLVLFLFTVYLGSIFYNSIFRISYDKVKYDLKNMNVTCHEISECKLLPGDILIRRYVTNRTAIFDKVLNPYFTHSAYYIGNGKIVEAIGNEINDENEIVVNNIYETDWNEKNIDSWVIVRPILEPEYINTINRNLEAIANNPKWRFGLPNQEDTRSTCADLIFNQLTPHFPTITLKPKFITPDYLFYLATQNPKLFSIISYNLE